MIAPVKRCSGRKKEEMEGGKERTKGRKKGDKKLLNTSENNL